MWLLWKAECEVCHGVVEALYGKEINDNTVSEAFTVFIAKLGAVQILYYHWTEIV